MNKNKLFTFVSENKFIFIAIMVVVVSSVFALFESRGVEKRYATVVHGPHAGYSLSVVSQTQESGSVLAAVSRSRSRERQRNTTTKTQTTTVVTPTPAPAPVLVAPAPTTTPVVVPTSTPTTTPTVTTTQTAPIYGIAAGGGLPWYSQADLNTYFANLKDLGVQWVRWDVDWSVVQYKDVNTFNWVDFDKVANTAKAYGIKSIVTIDYAPQWAVVGGCPVDKHCPPTDPNTYATFAGIVAARYKGTVSAYEIWNEQNYPLFWYPSANVQSYINLLKLAYTKIKSVDSQVIVMTGGLAAGADGGGTIAPITFVNALYASPDARNYFDALALHPYSYPVSPDYVAVWNSWQQMYKIHDIMVQAGESAKKIWVTEYGSPTGGPGTMRSLDQLAFNYGSDYMSEAAQQSMVQRTFQLYSQNKSWIGGFFWYSLRDNGTSKTDPENFFGLLRNDWSHKPAFDSLKALIPTL